MTTYLAELVARERRDPSDSKAYPAVGTKHMTRIGQSRTTTHESRTQNVNDAGTLAAELETERLHVGQVRWNHPSLRVIS